MSEEEFERVLCDDGMCTGIVGPEGRCGTCGRHCESAPPRVTAREDELVDARNDEGAIDAPTPTEPREEVPDRETVTDDDDRTLCPDGMCTGVLGADGRCGTCGTRG